MVKRKKMANIGFFCHVEGKALSCLSILGLIHEHRGEAFAHLGFLGRETNSQKHGEILAGLHEASTPPQGPQDLAHHTAGFGLGGAVPSRL